MLRIAHKRIERSKLWRRLASAAEWLAGEAKPPGVKWLSYWLKMDSRVVVKKGALGCHGLSSTLAA